MYARSLTMSPDVFLRARLRTAANTIVRGGSPRMDGIEIATRLSGIEVAAHRLSPEVAARAGQRTTSPGLVEVYDYAIRRRLLR
jgi:hypothetical protein